MAVNDDIDAIILRGEERTAELSSKYEGLNLEELNNFKSDASVQQWEGGDFRPGVCYSRFSLNHWCLRSCQRKALNVNLLQHSVSGEHLLYDPASAGRPQPVCAISFNLLFSSNKVMASFSP